MTRTTNMLAAALAVVSLAPLVSAQALEANANPSADRVRSGQFDIDLPTAAVHEELLAVKLADRCDLIFAEGRVVSRAGVSMAAVNALFAQGSLRPMITAISRAQMDEWYRVACAAKPEGSRPGHLAHWFYLECDSAERALELRTALRAQPLVEHCYREPRLGLASTTAAALPTPQPIPDPTDPAPTTPDWTSLQGYLAPAPVGTDLRWANGFLGGRGDGVKFRMVEEDWLIGHEDISKINANAFLGNLPPQMLGFANHGTAGSSLLVADRNCFGLNGCVDEVDMKCIAFPQNGGIGNGIIFAAADCDPGDIVMIVLMLRLGPGDWVPVELVPAVFDIVVTVTSNGRIVMATAANGSNDLDDPQYNGAFDRTVRDSGAIMGGASENSTNQPWPICNHGAIVDASSWGTNVLSAGYGSLFFPNNDVTQAYANDYTGTSASVPILAGVLTAIQGGARRQLGRDFTYAELRQLLRTHNTPINGMVGNRPDLRAIFTATGIFDGLELSQPDTTIGNSVQVTVSNANPGGAVLFASLGTGNTNLGFNRAIHLDLASTSTIDFQLLTAGQAQFNIAVPNNPALHDIELFLQAAVLPASGPVHVTNSGHLSIL